MNTELKQFLDALRGLSSDTERKTFFTNNRTQIIPLLADVYEINKDHCKTIIEEITDTFPKPRGKAAREIETHIRMELNKRINERNKDHFTDEVNFERDQQGNVRATIENMTIIFLKSKHIRLEKDDFTGSQQYAVYGDYQLPWLNSNHSIEMNYHVEHAEKGVTSIRYVNAMGPYELAAVKQYMQQFFKTETNWRMLKEAIINSAQQNVVNIYQDHFRYGLPEWDGITRMDVLYRYAGIKNKRWAIIIAKTMLLALMARCFEPGYDYRGIIIFEGKQNIGKSRLCKVFCFHPDFFTQFTFDKNHNEYEISRRLAGKAVVEFPDMGGIHSRETNFIKAFFTATNDSNRRMHSDVVENVKRSWVPVITTNSSEQYLNDETGNSRYMPAHCDTDHIDIEAIEKEMPMLLAEAYAMWKAGETPRLSEEEVQLQNEMLKPREMVSDYYHWLLPILQLHQQQFIRDDINWNDGATLDEIVNWCSSEDWFPTKQRHYHKTQISKTLEKHFKIESIIRFKQSEGATRKHRIHMVEILKCSSLN